MKKKIKKDKEEPYKISATIYTDEELAKLDHKIENDLDEIVHQVTEAVLTNREHIVLQKVIEKQQKEIKARLKEIDSLYKMMSVKDDEIENNYVSKDTIKEKIKEFKERKNFITQINESKYGNYHKTTYKQSVYNYVVNVLKELLGE